jgi:hypothetical protein
MLSHHRHPLLHGAHPGIGRPVAHAVADDRQPEEGARIGSPVILDGREKPGAVCQGRDIACCVKHRLQARTVRHGQHPPVGEHPQHRVLARDVLGQVLRRIGQKGSDVTGIQQLRPLPCQPDQAVHHAGLSRRGVVPELAAGRVEPGGRREHGKVPSPQAMRHAQVRLNV